MTTTGAAPVALRDAEGFCVAIAPRLLGALTLYCGRRDVAEELSQDVLVRVLASWRRVRTHNNPEAYVFRMAMNAANTWHRRRDAERRANARLQPPPAVEAEPAARMAVREAVNALPDRQRMAIVCRYYMDLDVAQTADVMRCAPGTVKAHTSKAIATLRLKGLAGEEDDDA